MKKQKNEVNSKIKKVLKGEFVETRGRKKFKKPLILEGFRASSLLSIVNVSELLTGKPNNIRNTIPVPIKHKKKVQELYTFVERWIEKYGADIEFYEGDIEL